MFTISVTVFYSRGLRILVTSVLGSMGHKTASVVVAEALLQRGMHRRERHLQAPCEWRGHHKQFEEEGWPQHEKRSREHAPISASTESECLNPKKEHSKGTNKQIIKVAKAPNPSSSSKAKHSPIKRTTKGPICQQFFCRRQAGFKTCMQQELKSYMDTCS